MDKEKWEINNCNKNIFNILETFKIGDLEIFAFKVPHDAAEPCGFSIYNNGQKVSIATDLGHIDSQTIKYMENSSSIMLEANYDPEILKICSYPYILKQRIAGPKGHLPNELASKAICKLIDSGLKDVLLVHLSKENNFPELAYRTAIEELYKNNYNETSINISIAPRNNPSKLINVS